MHIVENKKSRIGEIYREARSVNAFISRALNLMKRYLGWEVVFLTFTIVHTLTIALIGVSIGDSRKVLYLVIGSVLWAFLSLIFHELSENIAWERWEGTLEYTFMAPIRRITHLFGNCLTTVLYGLGRTVILLLIVSFFLKIDLSKANLLAAAVILALSSISFVGLGLIGGIMPLISPEKGPQATHIIQALILLVSGVYYDISVLPEWLQFFSMLSPATYTLRAMRLALLEGASLGELKEYVVILLVIGAVLVPLGYGCFRIAEKYAKRNGILSRTG